MIQEKITDFTVDIRNAMFDCDAEIKGNFLSAFQYGYVERRYMLEIEFNCFDGLGRRLFDADYRSPISIIQKEIQKHQAAISKVNILTAERHTLLMIEATKNFIRKCEGVLVSSN